MYKVKDLEWNVHKGLIGWKVCAVDCFGNEFARIDLKHDETEDSPRIVAYKGIKQIEYKHKILSAFCPKGEFSEGDFVKKKSGSWWEGNIVGYYSTKQTPEGYAVQLPCPNGPVQIYPASALEHKL